MYRLKVHKNGVVVLPKDILERLNIKEGDEVDVIVDDEGIYIFPKTAMDKVLGIAKGVDLYGELLKGRREDEGAEGRH